MTNPTIPTLDTAALTSADMAFIDSSGPAMADRLRDAVFAYLYTTQNARREDGWVESPSLQEVRDAVAQFRAMRGEAL